MNRDLEDFAAPERQQIIASGDWEKTAKEVWAIAEKLCGVIMRMKTAQDRAIYWLDAGAPGRAREELLGQ